MKQKPRFCSAKEAVSLIQNECALASSGFRYAGTPEELLEALGQRYEETGRPTGLALVFSSAQGNNDNKGLDHLAQGALLRRSLGGYYGVTPILVDRIIKNEIAGYNWPQGILVRLYHAIAAGQPGVLTRIGLGTYVDPRLDGGALNLLAREPLNEVVQLNDREYILYRAFPIDVCFLRATTADVNGNLSCEKEAIKLELLPLAMATRNSGGTVIAQVERLSDAPLHPRQVEVPGHLVDVVVRCSDVEAYHRQCVNHAYNPEYSGDSPRGQAAARDCDSDAQLVIARRAAAFLRPGEVINLGSGIPEAVCDVLRTEGRIEDKYVTVESGINGGLLASSPDFGLASNPHSIIRQDDQFNFYQGGGLDTALLGFAELDADGNVNVSRFGGRLMGCGGFIEIAQGARRVIFCGTFNCRGLKIDFEHGRLVIRKEGAVRKLVERVGQVTFSGREARCGNQEVWAVTERCVMRLTQQGWVLEEAAPGMEIEHDILRQMEFRPIVPENIGRMEAWCFSRTGGRATAAC
jgi:propionate CoA-transferase